MTPFVKIHASDPHPIIVMTHLWDTGEWAVTAMTRNAEGKLIVYRELCSSEIIASKILKHTSAEVWETHLKQETSV